LSNFENLGLGSDLLRGVAAAGFTKPFPIQERTITPLLAGLDVIGQARTGSGKTAAFGLPLLNGIDVRHVVPQAIVVAPTRELSVQISNDLKKLGRYTGVRVLAVYGGQSISIQLEALRRGTHVVVGTPGRIIDHIKRGTLNLGSVRTAVLDEADTMLDMGFIDAVEFILNSIPDRRQVSLFSATMPERIIGLSEKYMRSPEKILIDSDELSVVTLDQYFLAVERSGKMSSLIDLLSREKPTSTMIFCRTKYGARKLASKMERMSIGAVPLHGDLSQSQRERSMGLFRSGRADVLVATDVASRGIDIPQVDCVINYEVPQNPLLYFHRVGRTARAGDSGKAFTLISEGEYYDFSRIQGMTKTRIKPLRPEDEQTVSIVAQQRHSERPWGRQYGQRRRFNQPRFRRGQRYR
jgi:ATP-dependent RNA helicase DeaD